MNRTYRTLWSETTQTYVAVAENVKSHGKKSGSLKTVSAAVAAALLTLSAGQVMAVDLCTTTSTTIGTAVTGGVGGDNCVLDNGESVIVSSGGSISNTDQVNPIIVLTGATNAGSITNSGTISNTGTGSSVDNDAIAIYGQLDDVINDSLIQSNTGAGVSITNGGVARYIINSGTIESGRDSVNVNSSLMTGGITNSGTASHMIGDSNGIFVANSTISGNIVNEGTIQGLGLSSSAGISLRSSNITGGITNSGSVSVISGATNGIYLGGATNHFTTTGVAPGFSSVGGAIQNSGLIEGAGQNGIWLHGASVGSIVNEADAVISGGKSGIKLSSRNWAYFTSLSATIGSGVFKSTITGSITNRGLISAGTSSANANHVYGIHMLGVSTMGGSIINEGTIAGLGSNEVAGIALFSGSIITTGITNSGLISGSATSGSGIAHGISLKTGSAIGGIVNHGRIEGLGGSSSSGQGVGVGMADSRINGSIINFGTIEGVGYSGVGIGLNTSTIDGGITNSGALGSIVGSTFGLALANSSIGNSSIVGDIVNIDGARIEGQSVGIMLNRSTITGGITNSGTLSGGHTGIELALSTITGAIFNEGTINGNLTGIYVYSSTITGGITNSGTLSQILGDTGIYLYDSSVTGAIFNQGTIGGGSSTGIYVYYSTIAGGITNSGTLSQILGGNTGISLTGSTITGAIFNEGTINGIYVSGTSTITGGITNSGTIGGGANAIYVAGNSTLDSIQIQGNNTAKFIGVVDAANTPVTVAIGATYTMDDGQQFTVSGFTNDGTLKIGATTTAGSIGTITGDFTNSSSGIFSTTVVDATHYGQLTVTGTATLAGTLAVDASHAIGGLNNGDILSGIINAANRSGTFSGITDNSVLHDFTAAYSNSVDLTVTTASGVLCYGSLSGSHTGPCLVAFDAPDLINSFTISGGTAGVNILSGDYTGSVTNTGKISGSDVGIRAIGVNLAGGITNSGTSSQIIGGSTGLLLSHSTITGAIINEGN